MPFPASGGAYFSPGKRKVIRLILHGCTNRPFYHIVVMEARFRSGYITNDHLQVLQQLMEKCNEYQEPLCMAFIDYEKAFDSKWRRVNEQCIEQLGSFDPMPNSKGEKLISLNLERLTYWIGKQVHITEPCLKLFGLSGFFPIHPKTYMEASASRAKAKAAEESELKEESSAS